jgi:hypothetical protein
MFMKKTTFQVLTACAILVLGLSFIYKGQTAQAAVSNWQKGVTIAPRWNTDFSSASFQQSVQNAKNAGANYITLIIPWCQNDTGSSDIVNCGTTPTDDSLISAANYAHSLGLHVMFKVHQEMFNGNWRAYINPNDRNRWFSQYGTRLNNLATLAQSTGVEGMSIGAELISVATYTSNPDNTQRWQAMISSVRQKFSGFLTYSANWGGDNFTEEYTHIGFWGQLDYVGISGYFPLATNSGSPSVEDLKTSWARWRDTKIKPLAQQTGKPILFTEIGYKSVNGAHYEPWNSNRGGGYDGDEQSKLYEALFSFWNNESYISGVHLWDWSSDPNYGGQGNIDYTPHNKPAEQTMKQWFLTPGEPTPPPTGGGTGTTTPAGGNTGGTTGGSNTSFSMTGTISPAQPISGQSSTVTIQASAKGTVTNAIVDVEVYNSSGSKVFQKFFEGQNLNQTPLSLQTAWTPDAAGNYTVRGGIFNSNWSTNLYWNDSIMTTTVGTQTTPPPPPPTGGGTGTTTPPTNNPPPTGTFNTNVWWPTDGSSLNGVQPLKYNVDGVDASQYTGFWQVDGDRLNEMQTSTQDYPHKETLVDFTNWNWKGAGPYTLNFVSKNSSGTIISSKSVNIFVR